MKKTVGFMFLFASLASSLITAYTSPQEPDDEGYEFLKRAFCETGNLDNDLEPGSEAREDFEEIRWRSRPWGSLIGRQSSKESTLDAIQDFVRDRSYTYAYNRTKDRNQATRIASRLTNDFKYETDKYTNKYKPRFGAYRSFIGSGLHERVQAALNSPERQYYRPDPQAQNTGIQSYRPSKKYSNDDRSNTGDPDSCPICTDNNILDSDVRVYLPKKEGRCRESGLYDSCGHWICIVCSARNFLKENRNKCPLCNQQVNTALLKNILISQAAKLEKIAQKDSKIAASLKALNDAWPGWRPPSAPVRGHW